MYEHISIIDGTYTHLVEEWMFSHANRTETQTHHLKQTKNKVYWTKIWVHLVSMLKKYKKIILKKDVKFSYRMHHKILMVHCLSIQFTRNNFYWKFFIIN